MTRILLHILLILLPAQLVLAETEQPQRTAETVVSAYLSTLKENAALNKLHSGYATRIFTDVVAPAVDVQEMAKRAMGNAYERASARQQQAFMSAFGAYLAQTWVNLFHSVKAEEIHWQKTEYSHDKNRATVTTKLGSRWFGTRLRFKFYWSDRWTIYDIEVDRKSLVRGTRADFDELLSANGLARGLATYIREAPLAPLVTLGATDWGPYVSSSLPDNGLAPAIVSASFRAVGYRIAFRFQPFKKLTELAIAGDLDGFVTAWEDQEDDSVLLSDAYLTNQLIFVKRAEDPLTLTADGRLPDNINPASYRLGAYRDVNYGTFLEHFLKDFKRNDRDYCSQLFRDVAANSLDLAIVDQWVADIELAEKDNIASHLSKVSPALAIRGIHVSLQKTPDDTDERLLSAFNAGLAIIRENGTYASILARHHYPQ